MHISLFLYFSTLIYIYLFPFTYSTPTLHIALLLYLLYPSFTNISSPLLTLPLIYKYLFPFTCLPLICIYLFPFTSQPLIYIYLFPLTYSYPHLHIPLSFTYFSTPHLQIYLPLYLFFYPSFTNTLPLYLFFYPSFTNTLPLYLFLYPSFTKYLFPFTYSGDENKILVNLLWSPWNRIYPQQQCLLGVDPMDFQMLKSYRKLRLKVLSIYNIHYLIWRFSICGIPRICGILIIPITLTYHIPLPLYLLIYHSITNTSSPLHTHLSLPLFKHFKILTTHWSTIG